MRLGAERRIRSRDDGRSVLQHYVHFMFLICEGVWGKLRANMRGLARGFLKSESGPAAGRGLPPEISRHRYCTAISMPGILGDTCAPAAFRLHLQRLHRNMAPPRNAPPVSLRLPQ